jgi:transcriptional regulator with XRE-family HTH domain
MAVAKKREAAVTKKRRAAPKSKTPVESAYAKSDVATLPLDKRIGDVVRRRRLAASLTLAELSEGAGMSSATLSRMENGIATASLDSLERLCDALGMTMADLFQETNQRTGKAQLIKRDQQMEVVRSGTKHGYMYKLLSYDRGPQKVFDPFLVEMNRKSQSWPRFSHPGTEFIYVLQGRLEYRFGDKTYVLEPGDSLTFSGNVLHGPEHMLDDRVKFLSIIMYSE